jgi:hypothetical protein
MRENKELLDMNTQSSKTEQTIPIESIIIKIELAKILEIFSLPPLKGYLSLTAILGYYKSEVLKIVIIFA